MNAEIIAVGSELLTPSRIDTNSLYLTGELNSLGVEVSGKAVIGDDRDRLAAAVRRAVERAEIVILTGGLGPTEDDVTRAAVAQALERKLVYRPDLANAIEAWFRSIGRKMAEINKRQAYVIEGSEPLHNPNGTAPGLWLSIPGDRLIVMLPGPPRELQPLFAAECLPRLKRLLPPQVIRTVQFRVSGMGESDLDQLISPIYKKYSNPVTTVLAAPGDIQIHLRARCCTEAEAAALLAEVSPQIEALLGDRIYSLNGDALEVAVGRLLRERGATVAVAESCTGGGLAESITSVAGSSDYFAGGLIVYADKQKTKLLGVDEALIQEHSAVSSEVAEAMARNARERTDATYALSVTGEAGPDSATQSPPGTVFVGLASPSSVDVRKLLLMGDRERIRRRAVLAALDILRRALLTH
jgi:nicotinamide-nucleotide amidase